jgi:hypothetical protein
VACSYTQISRYLRCAAQYRYRYLDGWTEKEAKANMIFGKCFETALAAYFCGDDCTEALFKEWGSYRDAALEYGNGDAWDKLVHQGAHLLQMFARDDRVRIPHPRKNPLLNMFRKLSDDSEFVACIDAIGKLDGQRALIDWKTTTSRYSDGLLARCSLRGLCRSGQ